MLKQAVIIAITVLWCSSGTDIGSMNDSLEDWTEFIWPKKDFPWVFEDIRAYGGLG
jgi:hypothetical protein